MMAKDTAEDDWRLVGDVKGHGQWRARGGGYVCAVVLPTICTLRGCYVTGDSHLRAGPFVSGILALSCDSAMAGKLIELD